MWKYRVCNYVPTNISSIVLRSNLGVRDSLDSDPKAPTSLSPRGGSGGAVSTAGHLPRASTAQSSLELNAAIQRRARTVAVRSSSHLPPLSEGLPY